MGRSAQSGITFICLLLYKFRALILQVCSLIVRNQKYVFFPVINVDTIYYCWILLLFLLFIVLLWSVLTFNFLCHTHTPIPTYTGGVAASIVILQHLRVWVFFLLKFIYYLSAGGGY